MRDDSRLSLFVCTVLAAHTVHGAERIEVPVRVLLVDDEGALLRTITANLELDGFEVVAAEGAARALELAARESFDLVLTDIRMPGMDEP